MNTNRSGFKNSRAGVVFAILAISLSFGTAQQATAGPIFRITEDSSFDSGEQTSPISHDNLQTFRTAEIEAHAFVNVGSMGVYNRATGFDLGPPLHAVSTEFQFDVIFASVVDGTVDVQMRLELAGEIFGIGKNGLFNKGLVVGTGRQQYFAEYWRDTPVSPNVFEIHQDGMLSSFTADGTTQTVTSDTFFDLPTNTPVRFNFGLDTKTSIVPGFTTIVDFGHTLSLTTNENVFNIISGPADVTVNSADANIVNNRFTPQGANNPVPEPSSLVLLGLGGLGLCGWRLLRRRS